MGTRRAQMASQSQSFTPFPSLPLELRNEIWTQSLPGPRIIYLEQHYLTIRPCTRVWSDVDISTPSSNLRFFRIDIHHGRRHPARRRKPSRIPRYGSFLDGFTSQSKMPLAYVCRESRDIVERQYTRAFGTLAVGPSVWVDFEVDTMYFDWGYRRRAATGGGFSFLPRDFGLDRHRVKHLALFDAEPLNEMVPGGYTSWVDNLLRQFGNVKTLTLVDRYHGIRKGDCQDLVVWKETVHVATSMTDFLHPEKMDRERYLTTAETLKALDRKHSKAVESKAKIELDALQRFQLKGTYSHRLPKPPYEIPQVIQWKTVTARGVWEEYERRRRAFEKRKEEFVYGLVLRCDGVKEMRFDVKGSKRVHDSALRYLKARKLPNGLVLACATMPLRAFDTATTVASLARTQGQIEVEVIYLPWDRKTRPYVWVEEALRRKLQQKVLAEQKAAA